MKNILKTAALASLIGIGAMGASSIPAKADGIFFGVGGNGGVVVGHRGHGWGGPGWHGPQRSACTPQRAVNKATRMGIRHARVVDVDRRTIKVRGRAYGDRVAVVFARAPHCPVIR